MCLFEVAARAGSVVRLFFFGLVEKQNPLMDVLVLLAKYPYVATAYDK
jgi:hypothetical protein